ncbi:bacteriohopanetetrol glucosamine biosynthesis glycosyltransferase HpnI [Noviherbaspirillum massiliense]|uniref:bacteriohopanetetrol glucosamine biosynthesis glycosyltransferase HpnI n=1 Tax=Noviherbaspirillum massiliense TaxID=1465823 RepID=UPI0002D29413|nr:bacteriohopanetetrol glucosamine biosynthesis glycosyltransferase HpnI [Noviherbaspirillum massiliense]
MSTLLTGAGYALTLLASLYAFVALFCHARTYRIDAAGRRDLSPSRLPVTVLKPLCGLEPRLEENLATLCEQTYPVYQLLFGVRDPQDPAIAVIERLKVRFPMQDIQLVLDTRIHGSNLKVSNLINMMQAARHPWLVIADSDIAVRPDYLEKVAAPLADPAVGIVTCLYRGRSLDTFWSRLGALFIDTWFTPSVRVASAFGSSSFGFGATIAMRASMLSAIGGFHAIRNRLADDYWLGQLSRDLGHKTVVSEVCVTTDVTESDFPTLWSRERRWMQTIRAINPMGYAFTFVTFTFPMLAVGLYLAPTAWNWAFSLSGVAARLGLHLRKPAPDLPAAGLAHYAPLRDGLLFLTWVSAFFGDTAQWRKQTVPIDDPAEPAA